MFVLASSSPRRLELLLMMGYRPDAIVSPDIDESIIKKESASKYVERLAIEKSLAVAKDYPDAVILAGDTTVVSSNKILGKPEDENEARKFLDILSGRQHRVYTGISVACNSEVRSRVVRTMVKVKKISKDEADFFIASKQWEGKAGGYAIHGIFGSYVKNVNGSFSSIIGLPLMETKNLLTSFGIKPDIAQISKSS